MYYSSHSMDAFNCGTCIKLLYCFPHRRGLMVQYPGNITRAACAALLSCVLALPAGAQEAAIKLVGQEGQGAINNIPQRRAKEPVVQVQHENGEPVVGATVTFLLPDSGPGGTFADGARMLNMQTDAKGQATGRGLKPNATAGRFLIRVNVSYHGQTASTTVAQINAIPAGAAKSGGSGKKFLIIAPRRRMCRPGRNPATE